MAAALHHLVRHLRRWADPVHDDATTDRQLLARFTADRDEAAFAELVRRHGPMVLGVARRVLHDPHDAEDVFQAAFLVLARKAASVAWRDSVGGWLFPVVYRLALKVRAGRARRRLHEAQVRTMAEQDPRLPDGDLRAILDEELARLPDHYRSVVVLCYLEEKTQREAARQLGLTPGEVRGRLERARSRLRQRLARRGLALSGAAVAAALTARTASAAVPPLLAVHTARAAALFAAPAPAGLAAVATPRAVALAKGALHTMLAVKATKFLLILLAVGLLGAGALLLPLPPLAGTPTPQKAGAKGDPPAPKDEPARGPDTGRAHRSCIILWLSGGPSQLDTWDPKPGTANGGPIKAIDTRVKGIRISEDLPLLAEQADRLAIVRSMTHNNGDHAGATVLMHTGRPSGGPVDYPSIGALLAKELRDPRAELPPYVSMMPSNVFAPHTSPGFLGDAFAPLVATPPGFRDGIPTLPPLEAFAKIDKDRAEAMRKATAKAFDLSEEKEYLRVLYGQNGFGQGCLLARRLVERGVPVVEVTFGGWDTHADNFEAIKTLSKRLDDGFAFLLKDLADRKLLDSTLVVCMGEFGRTPRINQSAGRDHWMHGFSVVLAGAGIKGGQVIGRTSDDGVRILERPVTPPELHATIFRALNVDPSKENRTDQGQAVPLVDKGTEPLLEALK
jgi:RNA polymerase sigma factor (sigma-70 family)